MAKTAKTAAEIADMIVAELGKHPGCNTITKLRIIRPVTKNWDATALFNCPPECQRIFMATVQRLQALHDIEWPPRRG